MSVSPLEVRDMAVMNSSKSSEPELSVSNMLNKSSAKRVGLPEGTISL